MYISSLHYHCRNLMSNKINDKWSFKFFLGNSFYKSISRLGLSFSLGSSIYKLRTLKQNKTTFDKGLRKDLTTVVWTPQETEKWH